MARPGFSDRARWNRRSDSSHSQSCSSLTSPSEACASASDSSSSSARWAAARAFVMDSLGGRTL